jgi:hypothetical protein
VPTLVSYKEYQRARDKNLYNWQIPEHLLNKLTLDQLDSLGDLEADTNTDYTFRKVQFAKKFSVILLNISPNSLSCPDAQMLLDREKLFLI